jgi:hypothetical protein
VRPRVASALNNAATAALIAAAAGGKDLVDDACAKKSSRRAHPGLTMTRPGRLAPPPRPAGAGQPAAALISPAVAARVRQLAAQAEHRRAIAEFRARHAADQQARVNALLLEAIAALAGLLGVPGEPPPS